MAPRHRARCRGSAKEPNEMTCLSCGGELEVASGGLYGRCKACLTLFITTEEPGWPSAPAERRGPPSDCPQCCGALEILQRDGDFLTRCSDCGLLSRLEGELLLPIVVQVPGGGWNPEFQAIFEEKLGFSRWLRPHPPGSRAGVANPGAGANASEGDNARAPSDSEAEPIKRRPARRADGRQN